MKAFAAALLVVLAAAGAAAQPASGASARLTSAELLRRLGLPDTARVVIIHADDAAITPGANRATLEALRSGGVSSASVLATTPHLAEFAARAEPSLDVGVHLTITSEAAALRWPSVAPRARVRSLVDGDGMLRLAASEAARVDEIARELEAQLARVRAAGLRPTHIDSHQGALLYHGAERFEALRRVAKRACLPIPVPETLFARFPYLAGALDDGQLPLADLMSIDPATAPGQWEARYVELFATMRAGVTLLLVHLAEDTPADRAAFAGHTDYGLAWRLRDAALVREGALREMARWHGVRVVTWADLMRVAPVCAPR